MTIYLLACLLLALPALLGRRGGPRSVRIAGVLAAGAVAVGALDPRRDVAIEQPLFVVAVPTAAAGAELEALRARLAPGAQLEVASQGGLIERASAAALRDGVRARVLPVVVWTGPFAIPAARGPAPLALSAAPPPALEPDECRAAPLAPLAARRPALLEVHAHGALRCRVEVRAADGAVLVERSGPMPEEGPFAVVLAPQRAGAHALRIELEAGGTRVTGRGSLAVAAARKVLVVGADAAAHAAVLAVQGHDVQAAAALPDELADVAVLVLTERLPADAQQRAARFVDDGGGLFLVGGASGGALPRDDEPLHALLPVNWKPPAPRDAPGGGGEGRGEGAPPTQAAPPTEPQPTPPPPDAPPVTGRTEGAQPAGEAEVEVERRSIAMVLVIDCSASMEHIVIGDRSRIDYAKASAYETAAELEEGDEVAVVAFGINGQIVLPLTPVAERARIKDTLEGLRATQNETRVKEALRLTRERVLAASRAAVKHVVVITDGEIHDVDLGGSQEALRLRQAGATVSLIKILTSSDELSRNAPDIARYGGGTFYRASSPSTVPRLVSLEVKRALGKVGRAPRPGGAEPGAAPPEPRDRQPQRDPIPDPPQPQPEPQPQAPADAGWLAVRAVTRTPLLEPLPHDGFPPVGGILDAAARPEARVLLAAGDDGVPLLVFANRGLGRVAAWCADFAGEWGQRWREDPAFPGRLAAWVEALSPPLAAAAPADCLEERTLEPLAPVRAERTFLEEWSGAPPGALADWTPPPPGQTIATRGQAREYAGLGLLAMLLLALFEFAVLRRGWR
jgi:Mg-chelatase subunit ChlD